MAAMIPGGEVVELLQALIRNACVNDGTPDSGHEYRSVETLAAYLGEAGAVVEPHPGRQSAVYRIPGIDPAAPSLMFLGHTDVVPVSPEGWSVDPFAGERRDGFVWGRGAIDMLDQTAAMAAVFKRYLTGEARYPGDLIFCAIADEEGAGRLGARLIVDQHWDLVQTDYLITEIATPPLSGGTGIGIPVTVAEKGPQWRRFRTRGVPGHGSQPYGTANALVPLADALSRLAATPPPASITPEWEAFVTAWGPPADLTEALLDPDRVDDAIERIEDLGLARWAHACTHLTISPNVLHAGLKANVIPDLAMAEIDIRSLPGQDEADVLDHLRKAIGPGFDEIEYEVVEATVANGSAPTGPLWDAMTHALSDLAPEAHLVPAMIPVGTDARFFRRRGTVAYGVGLLDDRIGFGDFLRMFHGHDERVSEPSLASTAAYYARIVARLGESMAP